MMIQSEDTIRRHNQKTRSEDTIRRHDQKTQSEDTIRRHNQKTQSEDTIRRHTCVSYEAKVNYLSVDSVICLVGVFYHGCLVSKIDVLPG